MDKEQILKELGSRIRQRRIELGISQRELGLRTNKDQQAINRLETGGINPWGRKFFTLSICNSVDKIYFCSPLFGTGMYSAYKTLKL